MEMENSRRSAMDRSCDMGRKRPRLAPPEDFRLADRMPASSSAAAVGGRDRQFLPSRAGGQQPLAPPRMPRTAEREDAAPRGMEAGSHQELLAQYKTALAELTFNSKPIITNLTIIAGENLYAAKGIAAIICANVLEVPNEQKLPSLYLLDSIVKNIGKDYIKHFSVRLPEVFCKAYRQVDSSIHSSMRHLFGTWEGVFPSSPLQLIEKELGFTLVMNGSSGSTSKLDSQAQGPPHSIHVNPKYLEARKHLQQTTKTKELSDHDTSGEIIAFSDTKTSDRTALAGRTRPWENISTKMPNMQRPQREMVSDPSQDKKGFRNVQGLEFSSDISQELDMVVERISDRIKEKDEQNKTNCGVNMDSSQSLFNRRKTFDANNSYEANQENASSRDNNQLATDMISVGKNSIGTSKSWKNSEEEEYIWDGINSKASNSDGSGIFMRIEWKNDDNDAERAIVSQEIKCCVMDTEHMQQKSFDALIRSSKAYKGEGTILAYKELEDHCMHPHFKHDNDSRRNIEDSPDSLYAQKTKLEYQTNPKWMSHKELPPAIGFRHRMSNSNQSEEYPFSYGGAFGQRLHQVQPASPSDITSSASVHAQHHKLPNVPNYSQPRVIQMYPVSTKDYAQPPRVMSESVSSPFEPFQKPETISTFLTRSRDTLVQQSHINEALPQSSHLNSRLPSSFQGTGMQQIAKLSAASDLDGLSGHPDACKLLAAIMKSEILPNNLVANSQVLNMQPPLPKDPPPIKSLTSPAPSIPPSSSLSLPVSSSNVNATQQLPERDVLPPLPPGPPPSSLGANLDSSKPVGSTVNPISSLLSSLVAKGILSSSTESPTASVAQVSDNLKSMRNYIATKSLDQATSTLPIKIVLPAIRKESSAPKTIAPVNDVFSCSTIPELRDLIGIEFKSEIIRGFHPSVISSLFDDLKNQCDICGLRYRHKDDIQNHFDWHASNKSEMNNSRRYRRWYVDLGSWVNDTVTAQPDMTESNILLDELVMSDEIFEPMVPADESQSICILCGKPFEDFYSEERDEWMYKGTTYLNLSEKQGDAGFVVKTTSEFLIVHAQCVA